MTEQWRDIEGYDGIYKVSSLGRVLSTGHPRDTRGRKNFLMAQMKNSMGYYRVLLCAPNGEKRARFVHRLVAETFIPRPQGCDVVNHKDFNPTNNTVENLEWTTGKGNYEYSFERGRYVRTKEWKSRLKASLDNAMGTPVVGTSLVTGEKLFFSALNDVRNGGFQPSCVCNCCKGKLKQHKGYKWEYQNSQGRDSA